MQNKNNKGFTLVELLLVIAIIGILAAVLFIGLGKQRERARMTTFKENMRGLVTAATACHDGGKTILGADDDSIEADGGHPVCLVSGSADTTIGNIPRIQQCVGGTTNVAIAVNNPEMDNWELTAECNTTDAEPCEARCNLNGCEFINCE